MDKNTFNPDFKLSRYFGDRPSNEDELLKDLERNKYDILRKLEIRGLITSKDYSFITKANFDEDTNNCQEDKDIKDKKQAKENLKSVERYLNNLNPRNPIKLTYAFREDDEGILYNYKDNKLKGPDTIEKIFYEIFR